MIIHYRLLTSMLTWILDRGVDYAHAHKINSEIAERSEFTMAAASWLTQYVAVF